MTDLVEEMREAQEKIAMMERSIAAGGRFTPEGSMDFFNDLKSVYATLQRAIEQMEWVPVKTSKPAEGEVVLLLFKDNTFCLMAWEEDCIVTFGATHWARVPTPPQQEG